MDLELLPAAKRRDAEHTRLYGESATAPVVDPRSEAGTGTAAGGTGGSAWDRRLAPRHRRAVKTFFRASD